MPPWGVLSLFLRIECIANIFAVAIPLRWETIFFGVIFVHLTHVNNL